jgi:hypothetical protein
VFRLVLRPRDTVVHDRRVYTNAVEPQGDFLSFQIVRQDVVSTAWKNNNAGGGAGRCLSPQANRPAIRQSSVVLPLAHEM